MLIALDFDGTYTLEPALWDAMIQLATGFGHEVICVTMRYNNSTEGDPVREVLGDKIKIFFTERHAKGLFMQNLGIVPDVWIDDNPAWIYLNSE